MNASPADWPPLPYEAWKDTCTALHLWTQVVGKVRLARTPWLNHSWQTPLYLTARGLGTGPVPYGGAVLDLEFDFVAQALVMRLSDGARSTVALGPMSVAAFYAEVMAALERIGAPVAINPVPCELPHRDAVHGRSRGAGLRSRLGGAVLAGADPGRPGDAAVPHRVHRQGQPGAFLLGRLRPGGHPLLRPAAPCCTPAASPTCPTR